MKREERIAAVAILLVMAFLIVFQAYERQLTAKEVQEIEAREIIVPEVEILPPPKIEPTEPMPVIMDDTLEMAVVEETPAPDIYTLTADERELVARIVAAEAGGEDYDGMVAVAQVIRNRAEHPNKKLYGNGISEVCLKPSQFAAPRQGDMSKFEQCYAAVDAVFAEGETVFDEPITHFCNPAKSSPRWADVLTYCGSIGRHDFYMEK